MQQSVSFLKGSSQFVLTLVFAHLGLKDDLVTGGRKLRLAAFDSAKQLYVVNELVLGVADLDNI